MWHNARSAFILSQFTPQLRKELTRVNSVTKKGVYCDGKHTTIFSIYILYIVAVYATMNKRVN